jgi:hypothetical protein
VRSARPAASEVAVRALVLQRVAVHALIQPPREVLATMLAQHPESERASIAAKAEIDHAREVAEGWRWRSRTRELEEMQHPFPDSPPMRKAGLNSWDDVVRFSAPKAAARGMIPPPIDDDSPLFGKAYRDLSADEWSVARSITMERHFALNWLCGYAPGNRWDETPTET